LHLSRASIAASFLKNAVGTDDAGIKHTIRSPLPCVRFLKKDAAIEALERCKQRSVGDPPLKQLLSSVDTGDFRQNHILRELGSLIADAGKSSSKPGEIARFIASRSGAKELMDDDLDTSRETFVQDNIRKVVAMADMFQTVKELVSFIYAATKPSRKQTRLILSTVHGFKGLEARNVFVIGVNSGIFPHDRSELQEEKRLFYVAVSRPTDRLFVSCSGAPSDFIRDKVIMASDEDPEAQFELHA